jgi:hypothetical protein
VGRREARGKGRDAEDECGCGEGDAGVVWGEGELKEGEARRD